MPLVLSREDKAEYESESSKFRELQNDKLAEDDSGDDEEEFIIPKCSTILSKLKSKKSLLISKQRSHSTTKQDEMDIETTVNTTLDTSVDHPAKRVLRDRE